MMLADACRRWGPSCSRPTAPSPATEPPPGPVPCLRSDCEPACLSPQAPACAQMLGAQLFLADISQPSNRARHLGTNHQAALAGSLLGPALGGFLADRAGIRAPFAFTGAAALLAALYGLARLPETSARHQQRPAASAGAPACLMVILQHSLHSQARDLCSASAAAYWLLWCATMPPGGPEAFPVQPGGGSCVSVSQAAAGCTWRAGIAVR